MRPSAKALLALSVLLIAFALLILLIAVPTGEGSEGEPSDVPLVRAVVDAASPSDVDSVNRTGRPGAAAGESSPTQTSARAGLGENVPARFPAQFQGRSARWWAHRATHWKRRVLTHRRANRERLELGASGVARGLLCIHSFEGSWTDRDAPFWGGLQMDLQFQRSYGGPFLAALGTADRWPPFVQLAVAMRAVYSGRGFGPWPNTRRECGL